MVDRRLFRTLASRILVVAGVMVVSAVPVLWAAGLAKRARPPAWNKRVTEVFFSDVREKLVGERPTAAGQAGGAAVAASSGGGSEAAPAAAEGGVFAWSNLISSDTLESEIKALQKNVSAAGAAPGAVQGGRL